LDQSPEIISATDITGTDTCLVARPTSGPFALPACGHIGTRIAIRSAVRMLSSRLSFGEELQLHREGQGAVPLRRLQRVQPSGLGLQFHSGNLCVDCSGAGQITAIEADASPNAPNGMRQLQFGLRFTFNP